MTPNVYMIPYIIIVSYQLILPSAILLCLNLVKNFWSKKKYFSQLVEKVQICPRSGRLKSIFWPGKRLSYGFADNERAEAKLWTWAKHKVPRLFGVKAPSWFFDGFIFNTSLFASLAPCSLCFTHNEANFYNYLLTIMKKMCIIIL